MGKFEDCKVDAEFKNENEEIYRRKTKIIFMKNRKNCVGTVLMLNPGKCLPCNEDNINEDWREFKNVDCDRTQNKVASCVKEAYNNQPNGYVFIVNLSERKQPKSEKLNYQKDFTNKDFVEKIKNKLKEQGNLIKWVWIAFGEKPFGIYWSDIEELRNGIASLPNKVGWIDEKGYYPHPASPWFNSKYKEQIINQIKERLNNS